MNLTTIPTPAELETSRSLYAMASQALEDARKSLSPAAVARIEASFADATRVMTSLESKAQTFDKAAA